MVTTPPIAEAFARETDYFNTFGGNPVSATAGKAVLEIVIGDNLMANVKASGDHMIAGFRKLAEKYPLVGDIRGKGLFLTVELVRDRSCKEPAGPEAARLQEIMRENGVLLSLNGEGRNCLKIRPPLVFNTRHADIALAALDDALGRVS